MAWTIFLKSWPTTSTPSFNQETSISRCELRLRRSSHSLCHGKSGFWKHSPSLPSISAELIFSRAYPLDPTGFGDLARSDLWRIPALFRMTFTARMPTPTEEAILWRHRGLARKRELHSPSRCLEDFPLALNKESDWRVSEESARHLHKRVLQL